MTGIFDAVPGGSFGIIIIGLIVLYVYTLFYNTQLAIAIAVRTFEIIGKIIMGLFVGISRVFEAIYRALFRRR